MSELRRAARELRERLEIDRLFGWAVPLQPEAPHASAGQRPLGKAGAAKPEPPPAVFTGDERARREALLAPLRREVLSCTRCPLCRTRNRTVFGQGDPAARLMFVGEAPGADEDRIGEPFVGKAGELLTSIIKAMGLRREDVYIANILKCRPPGNRNPNPEEVASCHGYLHEQIRVIAPEILVALGAVAARFLLATDLSVGRLRGRFHQWRGIPLMVTYHPAYLLRSPEQKRKTWEDIQQVMARLGLKAR